MMLITLLWPLAALGQDGPMRIHAPEALRDSGLLDYLLPRFALKYGLRATVVDDPGAAIAFGADGVPVFTGPSQAWHLSHDGSQTAQKFEDWLRSDIGRRAIAAFAADGDAPFTAQIAVAAPVRELTFRGDPALGERLSLLHCGRCHVINETNRMKGMGATPSFGVLRTLGDWQRRFSTFYVLNPHPSFTQIKDLTPPFDVMRPPPIVPLSMTEDDLDAILAYVATVPPADLGAPIQSQ
ncbi:c-type cytochrome [Sulfitobacter sabulilitoris]|nr:cytochrome c [Sulfitobacter sabulilitoris]